MPDWTTHIGGAYLVARPWGKRDLRFFLLGALLPDFFARLESIALDILKLDLFSNYAMQAFHTPLLIFLLSLLIALFSSQPKRCCRLVFTGGMLHILMDMMEQKVASYGDLLLFPFSYKTFQLNLFPPPGPWIYLSWGFFLVALLYAVWEKKDNLICLQSKIPRAKVLVLSIVVFSIPLLTSPIFEANNVNHVRFIKNPAAFEGQPVSLHVTEVIVEKPLTIKEHSLQFTVVTKEQFKKGEWISMEGVYRQGKIYPSRIKRELGVALKGLLSLPALLLFPFLWWNWRNKADNVRR